MKPMDIICRTWGRMIALGAACVLSGGCAEFEESGLPGSASSMARNQMMLVRRDPSSFGHYRLSSLMRVYPDLAVFVGNQGLPDFLAETGNGGQDYFILYYLKVRRAYACRTRPGQRNAIEFAGPYPITEREYKTLNGFRSKQTR